MSAAANNEKINESIKNATKVANILNNTAKEIVKEKSIRRTRKQKLENDIKKIIAIKESGKYKGKKNLNQTLKNYRAALVIEEEKLLAKNKKAKEIANEKEKRKAAAKAAKANKNTMKKNNIPKLKVKLPTKNEMKNLSKNALLARFVSIVNAVKESAVSNTHMKAVRKEAKDIVTAAKSEYKACTKVCKDRYDIEYAKAKALLKGSNAKSIVENSKENSLD